MLPLCRMLALSLVTAGLLAVAPGLFAAPTPGANAEDGVHEGKLVSLKGGKLVMTHKDGQEHVHDLAAGAKLTLDGKRCQSGDLKAGMRIRVTTHANDPNSALRIEALDQHPDFDG